MITDSNKTDAAPYYSLRGFLGHGKPRHANNNIQPPLLTSGVLERPHAVAVHVPECARGGVHPALSGVALRALGCGALVDHALLHDCAVYGEAVGGGFGGVRGGGSGDEGFQDGVLGDLVVLSWWIGVLTMICEFHSLTWVCSYCVTLLRALSQA